MSVGLSCGIDGTPHTPHLRSCIGMMVRHRAAVKLLTRRVELRSWLHPCQKTTLPRLVLHRTSPSPSSLTTVAVPIVPSRSLTLYLARPQWTDGFPPPLDEKADRLAASILALLGRLPPAARVAGTQDHSSASGHVRPGEQEGNKPCVEPDKTTTGKASRTQLVPDPTQSATTTQVHIHKMDAPLQQFLPQLGEDESNKMVPLRLHVTERATDEDA